VSITSLLALPVRLAQRFFRRQQIIVQPIVREDGARKKRIIDAGPADASSTPTPAPAPRSRASLGRRFLNGRAAATTTPSSPSIWSPTPSPVKTNDVVLNHLPAHLDNQLAALHTPNLSSTSLSPNIWSPSPSLAVRYETVQNVFEDVDMDMDVDDSLDFSLSDALCSSTPPFVRTCNLETIRIPESADVAPGTPTQANTPYARLDVPQSTQVTRQPIRGIQELSPNTHHTIIKRAPITPMRKKLLRLQIGTKGGLTINTSPTADHTDPTTNSHFQEQSELQQKLYQASVLKSNVATVAQRAQEASEQYRAQAEARQNNNSDIPSQEDPFNHVETIDLELSFLSDAPDYEGEQTNTPVKKSLRWASHAGAKPFFYDEKIADMMDSTLESIVFSPVKPSPADESSETDTSEDDVQDASSLSPSASRLLTSTRNETISTETVGFTGVPASTWEDSDDSLEESQISLELLEDLQQDLQRKLALEPAPPPPPPVKALVAPLSSEEQEMLNAAAKKTDDGKDSTMWVVDQKLYARDFGTLLPRQFNGDPKAWLNDNIVNEYLAILTSASKQKAGFEHKRGGGAPPVHAFSSFWYSTLKSRPKGVERWAARFQLAGRQYLDAELILYPICDGGHWRLLAVKPKERVIEYLDSLGWNGDKYIDALKEYLAKELGSAWIETEWTVEQKQRSARQLNGSDCGVFTILNALALLRGEEFDKVLSCDGMPDARERIAMSLMKGATTTELE
jgi:hypothetical protein